MKFIIIISDLLNLILIICNTDEKFRLHKLMGDIVELHVPLLGQFWKRCLPVTYQVWASCLSVYPYFIPP